MSRKINHSLAEKLEVLKGIWCDSKEIMILADCSAAKAWEIKKNILLKANMEGRVYAPNHIPYETVLEEIGISKDLLFKTFDIAVKYDGKLNKGEQI
jgi:hypothetical protein